MSGQIIQTGYSDEPFKVFNNTFIRDGYQFVNWNTKKDGTGTTINPDDLLNCQKDTILYAQWKLLYKYMQLQRNGALTISNNTTLFGRCAFEYTPVNVDWTTTNTFELVIKILTPSTNDSKQNVFGMDNNQYFNLTMLNFTLQFDLTKSKSTTTLKPNTWYWLKFNKNNITYTISISEDGTNYSNIITTTNSSTITGKYLYFGKDYSIRYITTYTYIENVPRYKTVADTKIVKVAVTKYKTETIVNDPIWVASNSCCYRNSSYTSKLKHATKDKTKKNSCGQWKTTTTTKQVPYTVYEDRVVNATKWVANSGCYYYNKPSLWYLHEGRLCCGSYVTLTKQVIDGYDPVTRTGTKEEFDVADNFTGIIDFNESYIVLSGIKYKLKA